jgi:hypothetical protein
MREVFGTGFSTVVEDQRLVKIAFLDKVLAPGGS